MCGGYPDIKAIDSPFGKQISLREMRWPSMSPHDHFDVISRLNLPINDFNIENHAAVLSMEAVKSTIHQPPNFEAECETVSFKHKYPSSSPAPLQRLSFTPLSAHNDYHEVLLKHPHAHFLCFYSIASAGSHAHE